MSIQERRGDIGVDFAHHGIRGPDCAVEMLGERRIVRLDREGRKRGMASSTLLHC